MIEKPRSHFTYWPHLTLHGAVLFLWVSPNAYAHAVLMEPLDERIDCIPLLRVLVELFTGICHLNPESRASRDTSPVVGDFALERGTRKPGSALELSSTSLGPRKNGLDLALERGHPVEERLVFQLL